MNVIKSESSVGYVNAKLSLEIVIPTLALPSIYFVYNSSNSLASYPSITLAEEEENTTLDNEEVIVFTNSLRIYW